MGQGGDLCRDCFRQTVEGQRDVVNALGKELQGIQVAGRSVFLVDDEDIVAEIFRFAEHLGRQDDCSALLDLARRRFIIWRFRMGSIPVENSSRKSTASQP